MNAADEARRIAANILINIPRDHVTDGLDSDVTEEFEEQVYHAVRGIGFDLEGER